jgi:hypothetical protein
MWLKIGIATHILMKFSHIKLLIDYVKQFRRYYRDTDGWIQTLFLRSKKITRCCQGSLLIQEDLLK